MLNAIMYTSEYDLELPHFCMLHKPLTRHFFSCTLHYDLSVNGDLLWTLFKRGDVSSNWNLFRLLLNIIFFALRSFCTLTNSAYPDEMPHNDISPVCKCKNTYRKKNFTIEMQPISFLKLFLVPYMNAFTCCNLRAGKFDVSGSNMIIFWRQYFVKLRLMDSGNA